MKPFILCLCMAFNCIAFSQTIISGTIYDEHNTPLPFANVLVKNTYIGSASEIDGTYLINLPESNCKDSLFIIVTYIGYDTATAILHDYQTHEIINFTLKPTYQILESVTITDVQHNTISNLAGVISGVQISNNYSTVLRSSSPYFSDESYKGNPENKFKSSKEEPLTTLSIDVDNASYSNIRRMINAGQKIPEDAVRVEEMINYFSYNYPQPGEEHPFTIYTEYSVCPWNTEHKLLHVGLQGKNISLDSLPPSNLVFLIDVSGSMADQNKLPLVKSSLKLLVDKLRKEDRVAIVVYAGNAGQVLRSTSGDNKSEILNAIDKLEAGGSTAGGAGIELAYNIAEKNFMKEGNNRVILCTDGDFNVGISSDTDLEKFIERKRDLGIYLTCLGYGMGNYKDSKLEILADKGNGNYGYIDNLQEANKMLVTGLGGTLYTIAKDVKIQIEFNPAEIIGYRLIGYENRILNTEDFTDDKKDAGELGAGQTVTTIYEIIPAGVEDEFTRNLPKLKYQESKLTAQATTNEIATIKFRYKKPDENTSIEFILPVDDNAISLTGTSDMYRFSASVALFGMLLSKSAFAGKGNYDMVIELAEHAKTDDADGYKAEFVRLAQLVK